MIPYGRHDISQNDIESVVEVLKSDWITQGPMVPLFEDAVAKYVGVAYGVAVNSATSALHLACMTLGVGVGDIVWTSPITFVASANCARYCGADVDFIDIDPATYNISIPILEKKLESAKQIGKLPKVIIAVHFSGRPCDMQAIFKLSKIYGFKIIEDASHAIGASYITTQKSDGVESKPVKVGSCVHSDICIFSFHPVKIITTAEGGMALTKDADLANRMKLLRAHGITRDPLQMYNKNPAPWEYEQLELGYNYRMSDLQAGLGLSQISRLDEFLKKRNSLATYYGEKLRGLPLILPTLSNDLYSSWHLYSVLLNPIKNSKSHREVFDSLRDMGIGVNLHYTPVHLQPYYKKLGFAPGDFKNAEDYSKRALSLPIYPSLTEVQQKNICECIESVL